MNSYMGVDIGTSGCKAMVFDESGRFIVGAYREYPVLSPHAGWAELDSDAVIQHCFDGMAEAAAAAPQRSLRGIGISSQGEAFTPIDAGGKALARAMVSSDARAAAYVQDWPRQFGADRLYQITGHTAHPMFSLFKLLWLKEHAPDVWNKTWKFLCFEDLLQYRLGLDPAMGWPLAGRTMLFDVRRHEWSPPILEALGLSPSKLARPLQSGRIAGEVAPAVAARLNLGDQVVVVAGGHDQTCGALGAGVTEPGRAMYATGTVECITPAFSQPVFTADLQKNNLCTYDHTVEGMYATVAFSLTGGNILTWFRDEFGAGEVAQAAARGVSPYEVLLQQCDTQPSSLLVLPYFTPSGTPYFDPRAQGAILGLKLTTNRHEILRALLEGVAMEMRLNLEILESAGCHVTELRAIGGGAKSAIWNQLKADVTGKPIVSLAVTEAGCLGTAMLAARTCGGQTLTYLAGTWITTGATFSPRPEYAEVYSRRFQAYREMYPALRSLKW